jgi:hypothetical protein
MTKRRCRFVLLSANAEDRELEKVSNFLDLYNFYTHTKRAQENGYVERFQRTIQEYFVDVYPLDSTDIDEFNKQMMLFLLVV